MPQDQEVSMEETSSPQRNERTNTGDPAVGERTFQTPSPPLDGGEAGPPPFPRQNPPPVPRDGLSVDSEGERNPSSPSAVDTPAISPEETSPAAAHLASSNHSGPHQASTNGRTSSADDGVITHNLSPEPTTFATEGHSTPPLAQDQILATNNPGETNRALVDHGALPATAGPAVTNVVGGQGEGCERESSDGGRERQPSQGSQASIPPQVYPFSREDTQAIQATSTSTTQFSDGGEALHPHEEENRGVVDGGDGTRPRPDGRQRHYGTQGPYGAIQPNAAPTPTIPNVHLEARLPSSPPSSRRPSVQESATTTGHSQGSVAEDTQISERRKMESSFKSQPSENPSKGPGEQATSTISPLISFNNPSSKVPKAPQVVAPHSTFVDRQVRGNCTPDLTTSVIHIASLPAPHGNVSDLNARDRNRDAANPAPQSPSPRARAGSRENSSSPPVTTNQAEGNNMGDGGVKKWLKRIGSFIVACGSCILSGFTIVEKLASA